MQKYIAVIILVLGTNGCAWLGSAGGIMDRSSQEGKLSKAVSLLKRGNSAAAVAELESVCAGPPVPGVSDEALFRLGLLHLGMDNNTSGRAHAIRDLKRLAKEYPSSPWVPMAANLSKTLEAVDDSHRQRRTFDEREDSLTQENRELKRTSHSLAQKNSELKESNLSLTEESVKLRELVLSLTKENSGLRQSMEKLKTLDLELERKIKH